MKLTKEQVLGIMRHVLTFVGGILVVRGYLNQDLLTELTAGLLTSTGAIWSILSKR